MFRGLLCCCCPLPLTATMTMTTSRPSNNNDDSDDDNDDEEAQAVERRLHGGRRQGTSCAEQARRGTASDGQGGFKLSQRICLSDFYSRSTGPPLEKVFHQEKQLTPSK